MTSPVVVFGDAGAILANALRPLIAARDAQVDVGTRIPDGRDRRRTYVACIADAPPTILSRVAKRQPVRILVWDDDRDRALDIGELAHALAVHHRGDGIRSVLPNVGAYVDADPDTGEPMAACTVIANLKPVDLPPTD